MTDFKKKYTVAKNKLNRNHRKLYQLVDEYDIDDSVVEALREKYYEDSPKNPTPVDLEVVEGNAAASKEVINKMKRYISGFHEALLEMDEIEFSVNKFSQS